MIDGHIAAASRSLFLTVRSITAHPGKLTALIAAMLLGAGSMAVASLAPDASDLPVRNIVEAVQPQPLQEQADALLDHALRLYRSDTTRSSDTAESLLQRLGIADPAAAAHLRADPQARKALLGRAGRNVTAEASADNGLLKLQARWTSDDSGNFQRLVIEKTAKGFQSVIETAPLTTATRLAGGVIESSLFAATDEQRIPDAVATQVAEIFSGDIDFHRALRKGDRFSIVYETLEGDGEPLRSGRVLSAEFVNKGKTLQAVWFQDTAAASSPLGQQAGKAPAKGAYYTLDGQSLQRSFLTSPLAFSRVTSGFKQRFHPILNRWIAHLGVDYGAPTGTPVRTVANGVVEFAGVQNGFGNVVFVKHQNNTTTVYAHLSRIDVKRGESVTQSDQIGAVGSTGWATGPHLHFEFRVNGVHQDPLTVVHNSESLPVSAQAKAEFDRLAANMRVELAAASSIRTSRSE